MEKIERCRARERRHSKREENGGIWGKEGIHREDRRIDERMLKLLTRGV